MDFLAVFLTCVQSLMPFFSHDISTSSVTEEIVLFLSS